jgi:type II secretory pathway pseudopilin PulG
MLTLEKQGGFTYLAALFLVAILSAMLASVGVVWSVAQQRDKERELLQIGDQFRKAIQQYYEKSPGAVKKYPSSLNELLQDQRHLSTQRYLRKIFIDPMTRSSTWGVVIAPEGGIIGVYSLSEDKVLKVSNFSEANQELIGKTKYSEWRFVYDERIYKAIAHD